MAIVQFSKKTTSHLHSSKNRGTSFFQSRENWAKAKPELLLSGYLKIHTTTFRLGSAFMISQKKGTFSSK